MQVISFMFCYFVVFYNHLLVFDSHSPLRLIIIFFGTPSTDSHVISHLDRSLMLRRALLVPSWYTIHRLTCHQPPRQEPHAPPYPPGWLLCTCRCRSRCMCIREPTAWLPRRPYEAYTSPPGDVEWFVRDRMS